uniref:Uncharacterized protein n=1 Tax=Rhizophora mucronata TaxID=61149 RepID=A0A2P2NUS9_RHIMU
MHLVNLSTLSSIGQAKLDSSIANAKSCYKRMNQPGIIFFFF